MGEDTARFTAAIRARRVPQLVDGRDMKSTLSRAVSPEHATLSFTMLMHHGEDYWFAAKNVMRVMVNAVVSIWSPHWASAFPILYTGLQHNLFPGRVPFGWMEYTHKSREKTGRGAFLLLQVSVVTLCHANIAASNKEKPD